ncbi:MAG: hypothetical protein HFH41_13510 [Lachnospiraceae bacterium]|nr:hypothetical protein [Lachnospiraceae bacterium]
MIKKIGILLLVIVVLASCIYGYSTHLDCELLILTENPDINYLFQFNWFGIMKVTKGSVVYDKLYGERPIYEIQKPTAIISYEKEGHKTNEFRKMYCILNYQQIQNLRKSIVKLQAEQDKVIPEERWAVSGGWLVKANLSDGEYYSLVWNRNDLSQIPEKDDLFYNSNLLELLKNIKEMSPLEIK